MKTERLDIRVIPPKWRIRAVRVAIWLAFRFNGGGILERNFDRLALWIAKGVKLEVRTDR